MLSIIIPTLNEEKYLPFLLESLKKQSYTDYEVIVADAGSKDQTLEIAQRYNCKVVIGGLPAKGRNEGAKAARGNLLLFLDADTLSLHPHFLQNILEEFKKRKLDIASFPIYSAFISEETNEVCIERDIIDKIAFWVYNHWIDLTQKFLPYGARAILIKKEIHQKVGGFDETIKLSEDHVYLRLAIKFSKFGIISTEPILSSSRRFHQDGKLKTIGKYLLGELYTVLVGPIKSDIFKYRFGHYKPLKSKKQSPK